MAFDRPSTHRIDLTGKDEVAVRLKGLLPGEEFALYLQQDPTYPAVVYTHIPESASEFGTIAMTGRSDGNPLVFGLDVLAKNLKAIDLRVLKNPRTFTSTLSKLAGDTIETEANSDVAFLLNSVFRKDTCFALFPGEIRSNPRNIPRPGSQTGIFRNGAPTVGIDSGIIISTGFIEEAPGPNDFSLTQQGVIDFQPMNDDFPDAERLVPPGEFIHDVVILEFDFIPTTDTISFDYVFFSEQYCQSGNGVTNDAFGFLLSGPLGNDINIARLPVSGDIVSPATLNPNTPDAGSFLHNTDPGFDDPCFPFPPPPERFAGIAYDGFSVPLTAIGRVVPCARHTLKIVLLDAGDYLSDSGILLKAGSFLAGLVNEPEPSTTAGVGNLTPVEGCDEATITFTRRTLTQEALAVPLFVKYNVIPFFGNGTIDPATRGIGGASSDTADYILPVSPFVIPAGDTSGTLRIPILPDGVDENIEAFIVRYDGTCDCTENADTFYIRDNRDFDIDLGPELSACAGTEITLTASPEGGNGDFTYNWPDPTLGDTSQVTYVATGRDTTINLTMTDGCGLTGTGSVTILAPDITANVGGFYSLCSSPVARVTLDVAGTPSSFYDIVVRVDSNGVITETPLRILGDTVFTFTRSADLSIVSITDDSGCGGSGGNDVARIRSATINDTSRIVQPDCNQPIGVIDVLTRDGNENYSFRWLDGSGSTATSRNALPPGVYEVEITPNFDAACRDTLRFTLSGPPLLEVDTIRTFTSGVETPPACPGQTIDLIPSVSGGTFPFTFSWPDSSATDSTLTVVTRAGRTVYPFLVTDDCGESATDSVVIDLPEFSVELGGRYSLCNADTVAVPLSTNGPAGTYTVEIRIDSAGFSTTRFLLRSPGSSDLLFDYAATVTAVSITNAGMCQGDTINGVATVVDPQIRFNAAVTNIRCNGASTGSITLTDASGVGVIYDWSDIGPGPANRTGLAAATYGLRIMDTEDPSCFRDTSFVLTEPAPLSVSISGTGTACPFESDTLSAIVAGGTPPYTYRWAGRPTTDSRLPIITLAGNQTYRVTATDACGVVTEAFFAHDFPDVTAAVSGTYSVCTEPFRADVPVTFTGAGPYTFVISENGVERTLLTTRDTMLRYTEATEIQLISVRDTNSCSGIAGGIANVTDAVFNVVPQVQDVRCQNSSTGAISVTVNGNNSAYDFSWDRPGLSGPAVTGLRAGTYRLTVSDRTPFGCRWDTSFVILEPPAGITAGRDSVRDQTCNNPAYGAATYSGGTGQLTYTWSNGTTGSVLGEVPAGLYTLSVTDENQCEVTRVFNLQDRRSTVQASIQTTGTNLSCNVGEITLSAAQQDQVVTYAWRDQDGNDLGTTRGTTVNEPGRYFVTLTNPDNGCSATDSIDISRDGDLLELEIPAQFALTCNDDSVDLTVDHPGFTGNVSYEWRFNGAVVGNGASLLNVEDLGTYEVTVVREDNGCATVVTTEVVLDRNVPEIFLDAPVVTANCRAPEVSIGVGAGGPYAYAWSTANGNFTGPLNVNRTTANRPGVYTVILTDTLNGCTATASVTVMNDGATLTPDAGPDQVLICTGTGTMLNGSVSPALNGTVVRWYAPDGSTIGTNRQVTTSDSGAHLFEAIHPVSGCSSFDTVLVNSEAPGSVSYSLQQPPCPEVGGRLFVTDVTGLHGPFTYSSPTGIPEPFGTGLRGLRVGNNVLIVTDQLGCELRDTFQIFPGDTLGGWGEDVVIRFGEEAVLGITTNRTDGQLVSWEWRNLNDSLACLSCPDPRVSPLESFIAEVTVADSNGCEVTIRQNVIVEARDLIYMPSAFSPNGDGVNDVYTVFGNAEFVDGINFLHIFDRWGNLVFSNENFQVNDPNSGWTGVSPKGQISQSAVYVYSVSYNRWDGEAVVLRGDLSLVK